MVKMVSNALRQIRKLMNPGKEYSGKYAKVDEDGHLGFADGSGGEGKIYTGREPIEVDNVNDIVGISTSYGLTTENGSLKVAVGDGISFNDQDRIYLKTGEGVTIDGNNKVKANIGAGLEIVNDKIRPRVGMGLDVDGNNYLVALLGDGLNFDGSARISAKPNTSKGLFVNSSGLGINNGTGLTINGSNQLVVDYSVTQEKMSAPTTGGLLIANDKQIGINFKANSGLTYDTDGKVYVKLGDGLNYDGAGGVSAKPNTSKGLFVGSNGIGVNNGPGLSISSNQLVVDTSVIQGKLTAGNGITIDDRTNTITAKEEIVLKRVKIIGTGASDQPPTVTINPGEVKIVDITTYVESVKPTGFETLGQGTMFCVSLSHDALIPLYFYYYSNKYNMRIWNSGTTAITCNNCWIEIIFKRTD